MVSFCFVAALDRNNVRPEDVNYVVSTHGHSDHIGNNNLFLMAKHIVGFSVSFQDEYHMHPFDKGNIYLLQTLEPLMLQFTSISAQS